MVTRVMPAEYYQLFDNASFVQNSSLAASGETLVLANAVASLVRSSGVVLHGALYLTPGTGATGVILRLRRGFGITGAIDWEPVGYPNGIAVTAGKPNAISVAGIIGPSLYQQSGGGQYSLTVEQIGATAAGSVQNASVGFWNAIFWDTE